MTTQTLDANGPATLRPPTAYLRLAVLATAFGTVALAAMLAALTVVDAVGTHEAVGGALWYVLLVVSVGLAAAAPDVVLGRVLTHHLSKNRR